MVSPLRIPYLGAYRREVLKEEEEDGMVSKRQRSGGSGLAAWGTA
jgi:hypothetical protein